MAVKLQKFQTVAFDGWGTKITKANHIDSLLGQHPIQQADFYVQLLARNFGTSMESVLAKYPTKMFDDDSEIVWDVLGSARRNVPLVEARYTDGTPVVSGTSTNPIGANRARFYLVFDEHYFFKGEEIMGNQNQVYPIRIVDDARQEGTRYVYPCECAGASLDGIPVKRMLPGERFSYTFAPVERGLSKHVGGVRHTSAMKARNEFTQVRLSDSASGDTWGKKLAVGIGIVRRDASGKQIKDTTNVWMHYWAYEFEQTWREYKQNLYMFAVSNRQDDGAYINYGVSGEVIKKGDGIITQLERGNVRYYTDFSLKLIEDMMMAISTAKLELGQGRYFVLNTGEFGARQFSDAVRNAMSGWTEFTFNGDALGVVKKANTPYHETSLSAGYQFTRFSGPMGIVLDVNVLPIYDDPVINKIEHPNGGRVSSYRYDILDMGPATQANVFRCGIKGQPTDARSYQWGIRNPYTGQWGNPNMSYPDDKADVTVMGTFGAVVADPSRTVSFINALAID